MLLVHMYVATGLTANIHVATIIHCNAYWLRSRLLIETWEIDLHHKLPTRIKNLHTIPGFICDVDVIVFVNADTGYLLKSAPAMSLSTKLAHICPGRREYFDHIMSTINNVDPPLAVKINVSWIEKIRWTISLLSKASLELKLFVQNLYSAVVLVTDIISTKKASLQSSYQVSSQVFSCGRFTNN